MSDQATIAEGSRVRLHCAIALLNDGTVVEDTRENEALELTMGDGTLAAPLERCLQGMTEGDKQSFELNADDAFGDRLDEAVRTLSRNDFPEGIDPEPGKVIGFSTPQGQEVPGVIANIDGDQVTVDFNHPLAGQAIRFEVEILAVDAPTQP